MSEPVSAVAAVVAELPEAGRWVTLVPVEVFGGVDNCEACGHEVPFSYGLSDAVQAWSDCNRARGHIFRVDDMEPNYRLPGETVRVWVAERDLPALVDKVWGEEAS